MKKVILKVGGMSCSACSNRVEKYLNKQEGVKASVNLVMAQALIEYDEEKLTIKDLNRFIKESGYKSLGIYNSKEENQYRNQKVSLIVYGIILVILMYFSMGEMLYLPYPKILSMENNPINHAIIVIMFTVPFLVYGFDIIKSGITKLFHLAPNMDSLVTVGVIASFIYSLVNSILVFTGKTHYIHQLYFESVAMIIYFIKLGRFIDSKSKEKTKEAIKELVQITPQSALLKTEEGEKEVTIDMVKKGDILICKPGSKVAVDGVIVNGKTHLDESFITGESRSNKKSIGDKVVAGSINIDGYIEYEAQKIGPDSTISEIVRLVLEATNSKAKIQKVADFISGIFVPAIFGIAILTFIIHLIIGKSFNDSIISFVSVLVVACPCALGLATPIAIVVAEGRSAKDGILVKNSQTFENINKIDTVVFDKTGTLTYGKLSVSKMFNFSVLKDEEVLSIIANIESKSTHPIATAFANYKNANQEASNFENIAGIGLKANYQNHLYYVGNNKLFDLLKIENNYQKNEDELSLKGNSLVYLFEDNKLLALVGVSDILRTDAKDTVLKLKELGKEVIMLSGDNLQTARVIASECGIDSVIANVLPKDKENHLRKLESEGHHVMMVGDGINDAPSLAYASVGVAVSSGTDIAIDSADVILMQEDLSKILEVFEISKKTLKIIKENLFWALIYNSLMIPIAAGIFASLGVVLKPMFGSIAMTISSLTVVLNSLRLRKKR